MTIKDMKLDFKSIGFKVFCLFVFICPIFFDSQHMVNMGETPLRVNQEQFFQLGTLVLFALVFLENIYLSLFLLWSVALYCYYDFPAMSGIMLMNIFWACLLYQVSYKLITKDNLKHVFTAILWLAVANIVFLCMQKTGNEFIFGRDGVPTNDLVGLMTLKCFMGMFFAICIPILAYFNWQLSTIFFLPIYFSESSVAVVGAISGFLFTLWFRSKKAFFAFLAIFLIAGTLYVAHDTKAGMFGYRFQVWKLSIRDYLKHPIMGWGIDSYGNYGTFKQFMYFQNVNGEIRSVPLRAWEIQKETGLFPPMDGFAVKGYGLNPWGHPHNEYISVLFEFGIIGFVIWIFLCRDAWIKFFASKEVIALASILIVFMIISTGQFPFHVVRLGIFAPIMLGAYYKITEFKTGDTVHV